MNLMTNNPTPADPRDSMSQDELLMLHLDLKNTIEKLKADEMDLRKYIINRAFPNKQEGMNTLELGEGYKLKAGVKYNYKLDSDNKNVNAMLNELAATGNDGSFIAERLVSWTPNFLLTEYRVIQEEAETGNPLAKERLRIIAKALTITDAAPTLEIKEPKGKK